MLNRVVNINKLNKIELCLFCELVMGVHNKGTDWSNWIKKITRKHRNMSTKQN